MEEFTILEILGKNMHDIRFEKMMPLRELAKRAHLSINKLRKFEAGEYSGLTIINYPIIANALGVGLKELTKGIIFEED